MLLAPSAHPIHRFGDRWQIRHAVDHDDKGMMGVVKVVA